MQWLNNRLDVAVTLNPGFGPGESANALTPERTAPYGLLGFAVGGRLLQMPLRFPYIRACVVRGNQLSYGYRVLMRFGYDGMRSPPVPKAIEDVVIDDNEFDHTPVGIDLDSSADAIVLARNRFSQVTEESRVAGQHVLLVH